MNTKRSNEVILVKNLPHGTKDVELRNLFGKFGDLDKVLLPPSGITAIVQFVQPTEARAAFRSLAYSKVRIIIIAVNELIFTSQGICFIIIIIIYLSKLGNSKRKFSLFSIKNLVSAAFSQILRSYAQILVTSFLPGCFSYSLYYDGFTLLLNYFGYWF